MSTVSFIPFTQYVPDAGRLRNPGLLNAENVAPTEGEGFTPIPTLNRDFGRTGLQVTTLPGDSIQAFALGGAVVFSPPSEVVPFNYIGAYYKVLVGTIVGITGHEDEAVITEWKIAADGATSLTNTYAPLTAGESVQFEGWFFQVYGNSIIATAGYDCVPKILLDATNDLTSFVDLYAGPSPIEPNAKYVSCIGLHLLLANGRLGATDHPNRVWWSETDNVRYFSEEVADPEKRTSFQDLHDEYGPITGIVGATDYAYVAKEGCWYRMDSGGAFDYQFKGFGMGMGCIYPHSIAKLGDAIYFWSKYGPAVIHPGMEPQPLGEGVFHRTLKDGSWVIERGLGPIPQHPPHLLNVVVDAENELICWAYNAKDALFESDRKWIFAVDTMFIYNARHGRGAVQLNWFETDELTESGDEDGYLIDGIPDDVGTRADPDATYPNDFRPAIPFFANYQPNLDGFAQWAPLLRVHWALVCKGMEFKIGADWWNFPFWCYAYGDNTAAPTARFRTGFVKIDERGGDVQIKRVRVSCSSNVGHDPPEIEVRVYSMRRPFDQPMRDPDANNVKRAMDDRGWHTFPQTPVAALHQFDVRVLNPANVGEIEGIEVEWELAGK